MSNAVHSFQMSIREYANLCDIMSHDPLLSELVKQDCDVDGDNITIRLQLIDAEKIRESLTTQLATIGFDEHYNPNEDGAMIEKLIDKLYVYT